METSPKHKDDLLERIEAQAQFARSANFDYHAEQLTKEMEIIKLGDLLKKSTKDFDINGLIERRKSADPWVTLEIGPGHSPSGLNRKFKGESAYIAIEAGLSPNFSLGTDMVFQKIKDARPTENIFLLMDNAISRPPEDVDLNLARPASRIGKLVGKALGRPYAIDKSADSIESATKHYAIPDETADEIFVVHTFDDPDVKEQGSLIPREAYRMLTPGGTINVYDRTRNLIRINDLLTDAGFEIQYFNFDESTINNDREFYSQTAALGCYQQDAEHTFNTADKYPDILFIATKPATR